MNNFYASVEKLYDSALEGKPIAVCGDRELRHGIVLAKSEEAKAMGVKTGEAIWQAQAKCPELIIVPPHFERYEKYSRLARKIYCEYTDLVEPFGMDECWLDVTASRLAFGDGVTIAKNVRERIRTELGLSISVGVSYNKVFAKLGSDRKGIGGITVIEKDKIRENVWPLPVGDLLWVGPKSVQVLNMFGIRTIGNLAMADDLFLQYKFGKNGAKMKACARGEDQTPVLPYDAPAPMKSVGHGMTVPRDLETQEEIWLLIYALCGDIGKKLRFHGKLARGVALECKDRHFMVRSMSCRLDEPSDCTLTLAKAAFSLFREKYLFREPVRAVSVRAIDLDGGESGQQLSLFTEKRELRDQILDRACDSIRARFGDDSISAASLLLTFF